ncbi:MAG TPA: hypothetical protein VIR60_01715 [Gammaproteobacteria bacterium]
MLQTVFADLRVWGAAAAFAVILPGLSFLLNRRLLGGRLDTDIRQIVLLAALTFLTAILCEAGINMLYEAVFREKLWEYRLLPLHDRNVSALALLVWTAYGMHLYFMLQFLDHRIPAGPRQGFYKACIIGAEAPLLWEVAGNIYFLSVVNEFYAYYLPDDLFHFTSLRVVPLYMLCIYFGLLVYGRLRDHAHDWRIAGVCFGGGVMFLAAG